MTSICDLLTAHVADILIEWQALTTEEPWHSLPKDQRLDNLAPVVLGLIRAAHCAGDAEREEAVRDLVANALLHGRHRREAGFGDDVLLRETYLLREAIWRCLRQLVPWEEAGPAILYLDRAVTATTRASMLAFHADEAASKVSYGAAIERLTRDALESLGQPIRVADRRPASEMARGDLRTGPARDEPASPSDTDSV